MDDEAYTQEGTVKRTPDNTVKGENDDGRRTMG